MSTNPPTVGFTMQLTNDQEKQKTMTADQRVQELFGTGDKSNVKRQREEYAIELRKQKT
jgi:hypothetical protein